MIHIEELHDVIAPESVLTADEITEAYEHDESLTETWRRPDAVALPSTTEEVRSVIAWANRNKVAVIPRGSGTGLCGGCTPRDGGIVLSLEKMNKIREIDIDNRAAVVGAGTTLADIEQALVLSGLIYPIYAGEPSATIGGNIATNAGGMRAVRYGVTRHNVTGLEAVLGNGLLLADGGKYVKSSSGYNLVQLLIGSEGTLGVVTEATIRLSMRPAHTATLLAPFPTLGETCRAAAKLLRSASPTILEYIDRTSMAGITASQSMTLPLTDSVVEQADAYLLVTVDDSSSARIRETTERVGTVLAGLGALDVFVLPSQAAAHLIRARERAFFAAKANGAGDILDIVVPPTQMADLLEKAREIGAAQGTIVVGCGHVGDGNVHLSVFQPDAAIRDSVVAAIYEVGCSLGGAVSGEHGIGTAKRKYFQANSAGDAIELQRALKNVFDPNGILNPGVLFGRPD